MVVKRFVDSHSHSPDDFDTLRVQNVFAHSLSSFRLSLDQFYSIGIHPWHAEFSGENELSLLEDYVRRYSNVLAIGEIGLDRRCATDFGIQESVFEKQIQIASKYSKPVILHSVRASSDLLKYLKRYKFSFLVHGFNDNYKIATDYISYGGYLSIGKAILNANARIIPYIKDLPVSHLLVETDEESEIIPIYNQLASLLGIPLNELQDVLLFNFKSFFRLKHDA